MDFNGFDFENFGCPLFDDGDAEQDAVDGSPKIFATLTNVLPYHPVQPTHGEVPVEQYDESGVALVPQEEAAMEETDMEEAEMEEVEMEEATVPQPGVPTTLRPAAMPDEIILREFYHKNKWGLRKDLTYAEWRVLTPKQRNTERRIRKMKELTEENTRKMRMKIELRRIIASAKAKVAELRMNAPMMP